MAIREKKVFVVVFWNEKEDKPEMCQVLPTRRRAEQYIKNLAKREAKDGVVLGNDPARADPKNYMIREFMQKV